MRLNDKMQGAICHVPGRKDSSNVEYNPRPRNFAQASLFEDIRERLEVNVNVAA